MKVLTILSITMIIRASVHTTIICTLTLGNKSKISRSMVTIHICIDIFEAKKVRFRKLWTGVP